MILIEWITTSSAVLTGYVSHLNNFLNIFSCQVPALFLLTYSHRIPNMWLISIPGHFHSSFSFLPLTFVCVEFKVYYRAGRMSSYFGDWWHPARMPLSGEQVSLAPAGRILPSRCWDVPADRSTQRPDVREVLCYGEIRGNFHFLFRIYTI